jgi:hypothetical protein
MGLYKNIGGNDTTGIKFLRMDWKVFSMQDVASFASQAANYGLVPVDKMRYEGKEKVIDGGGMKYTFGWLVLERAVRA